MIHDDDDEGAHCAENCLCAALLYWSLVNAFPATDGDTIGGSSKKGKKGSKKPSGGGTKRKLRGGAVGVRGPKSFSRLLEDVSGPTC